ncbi:MAG TPA: tryptophan 2,3-dioxygenase [Aggregatilineales bacterium]|nr:tryptophan 2,3-dioxygenase [Anaerolineales bacterium]HRE47822.1 tryptophan 2,3-dioxygenase [Aggregatilineales bacterium]
MTTHDTDGAKLDFSGEMSYGDYLGLDALLSAQHPLSSDHNELLFIIQHQTSELWMTLMIHELRGAREQIKADDLPPAFKMMARVSRIMEQLVRAWDVLATLTPSEYTNFRHLLGHASGFQSHQYRIIEFLLGNKNAVMSIPHRHHPARAAEVARELNAPSLYDEVLRLLARRGLPIPPTHTERDWTQPYPAEDEVVAAWLTVYRQPQEHWELYELAEELVDLEDAFRQWRFRHLNTVKRIIGFKRGTGGTSGVNYLQNVLSVELFPELWKVRTSL